MSVKDNIGIKRIYAEYWFNNDKKIIDLELQNGTYIGKIIIPKDAVQLHYVIYTEDIAGNRVDLPEKVINVKNVGTSVNSFPWALLAIVIIVLIALVIVFIYLRKREVEKERTYNEVLEIDDEEE